MSGDNGGVQRHIVDDEEDRGALVVERTVQQASRQERSEDWVVVEEPIEIQVRGFSTAVLMRTPGADEDLVRGFLRTEGIVDSPDHIRSVRPCSVVEHEEAEGNVFQVGLSPEVDFDPARFQRNLFASSSCGLCGKASIESAMRVAPPLDTKTLFNPEVISAVPARLRAAQAVFELTGGLHAAGAFARDGRALAIREDVGRHNAVDKVVGALGNAEAPVLAVSGRVSFEIVQKALAARFEIIVAVSAPSSLAVKLADAGGITLVAFARGERFSIYTHPDRLQGHPDFGSTEEQRAS